MKTLTLAAETVVDLSLSLCDYGQDVNTLTLAAETVVDLSLSWILAKT